MPGIRRVRRGRGFAYRAADGHWLRREDAADAADLQRIRALAIPPAYEDVWICPTACGHLQATGRDAKGRKQYRYHPQWRARMEDDKFHRMVEFGEALPRLRRRVARTLSGPVGHRPGREVMLAALVRLLDTTLVRVGNQTYARLNRSYGLTTLRNRHAEVCDGCLILRFRGKSGVHHEVTLHDEQMATLVQRCQALPGQHLFQYVDEDGQLHRIDSADVNELIRAWCGQDFTAKDFRTWHATVHAWARLSSDDAQAAALSLRARRRAVGLALREVASRLGNTVAVCRRSYVHPEVLTCALEGAWPGEAAPPAPRRGLSLQERRVLEFLRARASATG